MTTSKQTNTGKQLIHEIVATDKSKIVSANSKKEALGTKQNLHTVSKPITPIK
jgi:hypothetical protein